MAGFVTNMCPEKVAARGLKLVSVALRVCWYEPSNIGVTLMIIPALGKLPGSFSGTLRSQLHKILTETWRRCRAYCVEPNKHPPKGHWRAFKGVKEP